MAKTTGVKKQDLEKFRLRLEEMRARLLGHLANASQDVQSSEDSAGYSQHQADEGTDNFDRTISIELSGQDQELLKQIDRALEKMDENTYGICDVTGDPIPVARLEAIPYANMTVQAQEKLEKGLL